MNNQPTTYTITNTQTGWSKSSMSADEVKQFHFNKLSKSGFSPIAVVDYQVKNEQNNEIYNLSNLSL